MQLQQPEVKSRSKAMIKQTPQVAIKEPLDPNRVFIKLNGHPVLALVDLQNVRCDLISAQFVCLY